MSIEDIPEGSLLGACSPLWQSWEAVESLRGRAQKKVMRSLRPHSGTEVMKFSQELNAPYKNRMLSKEQDDF